MGQSKGNGYSKVDAVTSEQKSFLDNLLQQAQSNQGAAADIYKGLQPGGDTANAITNQANQNFQQQTLPSILNAFGTGSKGSSSLNQALASGASNLNTNIAAQLAQLQGQAAAGLGSIGNSQAGLGAGTSQFGYQQNQQPFWQQLLLGGIGAAGQVGKGFI